MRHAARENGDAMRSARGARVRLKSRAVQSASVMELDLDRPAGAASLDGAVEYRAVARGRLGRCSARRLARGGLREQARDVDLRRRNVESVSAHRIETCDVRVRDGGGRSFDRGLARILRERVREHTILDHTQPNDRERANAEEDRRDHERLPALTAHGVHSMRREALAVTTKRGRPTNPSGTGRA